MMLYLEGFAGVLKISLVLMVVFNAKWAGLPPHYHSYFLYHSLMWLSFCTEVEKIGVRFVVFNGWLFSPLYDDHISCKFCSV